MLPTLSAEKRRVPRVPVAMKVEESSGEETIGFGYARDISERGLAVEAEALTSDDKTPRLGTEVRMRFKLPRSNLVITARGRVIRVERETDIPRIAMEFVALSADFRAAIVRYIDWTLAKR